MNFENLVRIDENGYFHADYPTFLEAERNDFLDVYGADTYIEPDSQDGQLIAASAKAKFDFAVLGLHIYNSYGIKSSQGAPLARLVKLNGIAKQAATFSTAQLTIIGSAGTTILNGVAADTLGQKWVLPLSVIVPPSGSISVTAISEVEGAISAQAGSINRIHTPTTGWQSVTNPTAASIGAPVETDFALRKRQEISVALPSLSVMEGIKGAVANVVGVTRSEGYENDTSVTDGDGLPPHSLSFVVEGGNSLEIATAIARKKTPGSPTYGDVSVEVFDSKGVPNTINFFRPIEVQTKVEITIKPLSGYSTAFNSQIISQVAALINGLGIGKSVLISKLYVPANLPGTEEGSTFDIEDLKIAKLADPYDNVNIPIAFNEAASINPNEILIVVA